MSAPKDLLRDNNPPCTLCKRNTCLSQDGYFSSYTYPVFTCTSTPLHIICRDCRDHFRCVCPAAELRRACPACHYPNPEDPARLLIANPFAIGEMEQTPELCRMALAINGEALPLIKDITPDMYEIAVKSNSSALIHVPPEYHSTELYLAASEIGKPSNTAWAAPRFMAMSFEHIPVEMMPRFVKNDLFFIYNMPDEMITEEMLTECIRKNPFNINEIPSRFLTQKLCDLALSVDIDMYKRIPDIYKTEKNTLEALWRRGNFIEFVPRRMLTYEMCYAAAVHYPDHMLYEYIPEEFLSDEIRDMIDNMVWNGDMLHTSPTNSSIWSDTSDYQEEVLAEDDAPSDM